MDDFCVLDTCGLSDSDQWTVRIVELALEGDLMTLGVYTRPAIERAYNALRSCRTGGCPSHRDADEARSLLGRMGDV